MIISGSFSVPEGDISRLGQDCTAMAVRTTALARTRPFPAAFGYG